MTLRSGGEQRSSFVDMGERVLRLADALRGLGVRPGNTVATLVRNRKIDKHTPRAQHKAGTLPVLHLGGPPT